MREPHKHARPTLICIFVKSEKNFSEKVVFFTLSSNKYNIKARFCNYIYLNKQILIKLGFLIIFAFLMKKQICVCKYVMCFQSFLHSLLRLFCKSQGRIIVLKMLKKSVTNGDDGNLRHLSMFHHSRSFCFLYCI